MASKFSVHGNVAKGVTCSCETPYRAVCSQGSMCSITLPLITCAGGESGICVGTRRTCSGAGNNLHHAAPSAEFKSYVVCLCRKSRYMNRYRNSGSQVSRAGSVGAWESGDWRCKCICLALAGFAAMVVVLTVEEQLVAYLTISEDKRPNTCSYFPIERLRCWRSKLVINKADLNFRVS